MLTAAALLAAAGSRSPRASAANAETLRGASTVSAAQLLSRINASDDLLASYSVPIHVEARLHRLFTFRFGLNGTVYYKRPDRVALDMQHVPGQFRRLFDEMGTPLTWSSTYDVSVASSTVAGGRATYHIKGVPKHDGEVVSVLLDVDQDMSGPVHAQWFCRDGTRIDETITESIEGVYELPKHVEADIFSGGLTVHATIDYGAYDVNQSLADSLFANA